MFLRELIRREATEKKTLRKFHIYLIFVKKYTFFMFLMFLDTVFFWTILPIFDPFLNSVNSLVRVDMKITSDREKQTLQNFHGLIQNIT